MIPAEVTVGTTIKVKNHGTYGGKLGTITSEHTGWFASSPLVCIQFLGVEGVHWVPMRSCKIIRSPQKWKIKK